MFEHINIKIILTILVLVLVSFYIYHKIPNDTDDTESICSELVIEDSSLEDCISNFVNLQNEYIED